MAVELQTILDTFAAKVAEKLSFITVGAQKATLEGKGTDLKVSLRVIDPTNTTGASGKDSATVGRNNGSITLGDLNEKKVEVPMVHYYRAIGASIIDEAVKIGDPLLQQHLEKEAQAMAAEIRKDGLNKIYKANKAYVGGWEEVETASGELGDTADGKVFGFLSHKAKSKLSVSQPFGSQVGELLYRAAEIGQGKDGSYFYNEKTLPTITLSADTFSQSLAISAAGVITGTITGTTGTQTLPAGTPIKLKGLKACDALGNVTDEDAVIILKSAVTPASKVYTLTGKVEDVIISGAGRQIADEDGTDYASGDITGVSIPDEGTYYIGFAKVENADTYGSVPVKAKDGDYKETNVDGVVISINSFTDKGKVDMVNGYRFDSYLAQGVVDPRLTSLIYIKK